MPKRNTFSFGMWLKHISKNDLKKAASILKDMSKHKREESVWKLIEATEDKEITDETYLKAARLAFELRG